MSNFERLGQSAYIATLQRLQEAQRVAVTPSEQTAATADLREFLRLSEAGRLSEWYTAREVRS